MTREIKIERRGEIVEYGRVEMPPSGTGEDDVGGIYRVQADVQ